MLSGPCRTHDFPYRDRKMSCSHTREKIKASLTLSHIILDEKWPRNIPQLKETAWDKLETSKIEWLSKITPALIATGFPLADRNPCRTK